MLEEYEVYRTHEDQRMTMLDAIPSKYVRELVKTNSEWLRMFDEERLKYDYRIFQDQANVHSAALNGKRGW